MELLPDEMKKDFPLKEGENLTTYFAKVTTTERELERVELQVFPKGPRAAKNAKGKNPVRMLMTLKDGELLKSVQKRERFTKEQEAYSNKVREGWSANERKKAGEKAKA